jgi:hypothetical protein
MESGAKATYCCLTALRFCGGRAHVPKVLDFCAAVRSKR